MGEDEDRAQPHERGEPEAVARIIGEDEEGAAERDIAAMESDAVDDGGHAELAHAVMQEVAALAAGDRAARLPVREVRSSEAGGAAEPLSQQRRQPLDVS